MPTNVTEERIELTAVDKMSGVFRQAQGSVNQLRSSVDTVKNALAAVGLTIGVGAMLKLYTDVVKANAALHEMGEMTGASVENLSKLQTVAKIGGRDFDFVGESIGKMIKGLKGADEEGQNAGQALAFLGIKAKNADGTFRDTAQITLEVARALDIYADSGNKVALVQDLYGKGAQRMLPYLKDLAEAGEINAGRTNEQAAAADQAEKNMRRLTVALQEQRQELVIGLTPAVSAWTEQTTQAIKIAGGLAEFYRLFVFNLEALSGDAPRKQIERLTGALNAYQAASGFGKFMQSPTGYLFGGRAEDLEKQIAFLRFMQDQPDAARARAGRSDPQSPYFEFGGQPLDYQSQGKGGKDGAAAALREATFRAEKQVELEEMAAQDSREAWEIYTKGRVEQDEAFRRGHEQMWRDVFKTIDDEQDAAIERGRELLESQAEATKKATAEAERFAMTIDLAFDRAVRGGGDFLDILKQLGTELAMIELKKRFFEPASKGLSGFLDELFKRGGENASSAGGSSGVAALAEGYGSSYASGTDFVPRDGMAYLHRGERVVPAAENRGGIGNTVTVHQTINVDSRSDMASIIQAMHVAKERAKAEIADSLNRGSSRFRSP